MQKQQDINAYIKQLEARIAILEEKAAVAEDIEAIKKLQRAYGYYIQYGMADEIVDLFYDGPDAKLQIAAGEFKGKKGVRRFLSQLNPNNNPEFLHQVMQISGMIDVAPDGKTAFGRWYGFGADALVMEDGVSQNWMNGVYENEYIKEDGKWKFKNVIFHLYFFTSFEEGWAKIPYVIPRDIKAALGRPDMPATEDKLYPTGYLQPVHFKNPVTGK